MKCPKCQKDNSPGVAYCVWCGYRMARSSDDTAQPPSQRNEIQEVKQRLREMSLRLSALEQQVRVISGRMSLDALPEPTTLKAQQGESRLEARPGPAAAAGTQAGEPYGAARVKPGPAESFAQETPCPTPESTPRPRRDWESSAKRVIRVEDWEQALPGNWLSRIGIVALFIGLGFLVKMAYDRHWIHPVVQLLAGLACGGLLLWGGQHWNKRYRVWAQALTGGGVAVLYLSIFASYALHGLMPFFPTFALMFLVTVVAVGIALRQESMAIAVIGIAGAFLIPVILGASDYLSPAAENNRNNPVLLISYILVLDAGIVWLATLRNWRWFTFLGLAGSLLVYGMWHAVTGHDGSAITAQGMLTGIFLCFVAATMLFHVIRRRTPELTDLALMSLNAAVYFGFSYRLLWHDYRGWMGMFSLLLAGFYGLLGYLALRRGEANRRLCAFAVGIAIVFLTIAIPVQLHRSWITVAWAAEGAVLIWISTRWHIRHLQAWGLGAFVLVLVRLVVFDRVVDQVGFRPVLDSMFLPFAVSIAAFYVAAYFLRRDREVWQPWLFSLMVLVANFLTVWLFSAEIVNFVGGRIIAKQAHQAAFSSIRDLENARNLALVSLWAVYGFCLMMTGIRRKWDWLRIGGNALIAVASGMTLILLNHSSAGIHWGTSTPIVNYSFAAFAVCTGVLYLFAYVMAKNSDRLHDVEKRVLSALIVGANVLSLFALSSEVLTYVGSGYARSMGLTLLWSTYALVLILVGIIGKWRWVRVGGLALVSVAVVKLFLWDTFRLESGYRVAAYLVLGVLLLAGGFMYHKYADVIKGFILDGSARGDSSSRGQGHG